jgi:hypothetical protein
VIESPWRVNEGSLGVVIPISRTTKEERNYITLAEAKDVKIEDTGQIDSIYIHNNEDKPLYISRGEIFRGKTQERAAIHGHIIMAGKGMRVSVRCIHNSKGIQKGAEMTFGGKVPFYVYNNLNDQGATWRSVETYNTCYYNNNPRTTNLKSSWRGSQGSDNITLDALTNSTNPTNRAYFTNTMNTNDFIMPMADLNSINIGSSDDMVNTIDDMTTRIKEAMKKIPPIENQVGAIFLYENSFQGLDIYNVPDSWSSVKEETIAKEGSSFMKKDDTSIFDFKPERVKALIGKELGGKFEEKIIYGEKQGEAYKIIEIREIIDEKSKKRIIGEAVEFNGKIIHLTLSRV